MTRRFRVRVSCGLHPPTLRVKDHKYSKSSSTQKYKRVKTTSRTAPMVLRKQAVKGARARDNVDKTRYLARKAVSQSAKDHELRDGPTDDKWRYVARGSWPKRDAACARPRDQRLRRQAVRRMRGRGTDPDTVRARPDRQAVQRQCRWNICRARCTGAVYTLRCYPPSRLEGNTKIAPLANR